MEPVAALAPTFDNTERILRGVRADQWDAPTPCPSYSTRDVANHLVGGLEAFTAGLTGESGATDEDHVGDDPAEAYAVAAQRDRSAWEAPGALEAILTLPWGPSPGSVAVHLALGDSLLHGWDVAVATGQDPRLPEDAATVMLTFMQGMLKPEMRADGPDATFGRERPVADGASVVDRLLAFSGRDPAWRP